MLDLAWKLLPWGLAVGFAALLDRIRAYEPRPVALADNLQWAVLASEGVVQNRDGALSRTWSYQGVDTEVASPEELNALSQAINLTLVRLGSGVMLHADAVRRRAEPAPPGEHFPHPLAYLIDAERFELHSREPHFETEFFLTLTVAPPARVERTLQHLFLSGIEETAQAAEARVGRLQDLSVLVESYLGRLLRLKRLSSAEQLAFLHLCLTGLDHPVAVPAPGQLLASILSDQEFSGGWRPRIGTRHLRVVRVNAYPTTETSPALLDPLADLPERRLDN
jgi:type IV secretion system protein VirB4